MRAVTGDPAEGSAARGLVFAVVGSLSVVAAVQHSLAGTTAGQVALYGCGLDPLTDQQPAAVLRWVPAGFVHTGIALWLFVSWLGERDRSEATAPPAVGAG